MTKVVDLGQYRRKIAADRAFHHWKKRFQEKLDEDSRLIELTDSALAKLLEPGQESQDLVYVMIMGALNVNRRVSFTELNSDTKMKLLDISLFFLDQVRFECMRRLGWVAGFPGESYPMIALVLDYPEVKQNSRPAYPEITKENPDYEEFMQVYPGDREMFIRQQIPKAIKTFTRRLQNKS